ncbi:MAG: orotate phosphoribosyltransferase [Oscillospiraceae bacterium]|jgi:orotate phosphoribosyltransferase|nr:orotate phosphoribosyltransferase [Oscillospiraceae bacterium]
MDKQAIAKRIYGAAHLTGTFTLRSGQVSNEYFDKYLFEADPVLLGDITKVMKPLIPEGTQVLAGLEMGGIPIVTALSAASSLPAAFVRKQAKEYGTCKLAEGADTAGLRVCVVEDVVTTGGQIIESVRELRRRGALVEHVLCVILRNEKAIDLLATEGLTLIPAFTMEYIKICAER